LKRVFLSWSFCWLFNRKRESWVSAEVGESGGITTEWKETVSLKEDIEFSVLKEVHLQYKLLL
jgi:hypothetical protein